MEKFILLPKIASVNMIYFKGNEHFNQKKSPLCFQTLLDLGVSPNMKDSRSLTPLYYTVSHCTSPTCMEMLLQERAFIGAQDEQGWFEIHHVRNYITIACGRLSFDLIIYILMHV